MKIYKDFTSLSCFTNFKIFIFTYTIPKTISNCDTFKGIWQRFPIEQDKPSSIQKSVARALSADKVEPFCQKNYNLIKCSGACKHTSSNLPIHSGYRYTVRVPAASESYFKKTDLIYM